MSITATGISCKCFRSHLERFRSIAAFTTVGEFKAPSSSASKNAYLASVIRNRIIGTSALFAHVTAGNVTPALAQVNCTIAQVGALPGHLESLLGGHAPGLQARWLPGKTSLPFGRLVVYLRVEF